LTVSKRPITITAIANQKYCGQVDPDFTATVTNGTIVNNDQPSGTLTRTDLTNEGVAVYSILKGTYTFGPNYEETYISANFTILGVAIDASASSAPVPETVGSATLSATVVSAPGGVLQPGVSVTFVVTDENDVEIYTDTKITNSSGVATATVTGLTLGVYKVVATAGTTCGSSVAYIPVYDPNGNFVTGGGWINSPAGSLKADVNITGKANFGFVSKYKKGSSQVDGNTEFQFHAGNINFKSTMHESGSLVIAGGKATYRGTGTINGLSGYKFTIIANDGHWNNGTGPDKFRIKITTTTGTVVYDNEMGADENGNATTALGGGSIVIHEVKKKTSNRMEPGALVLTPQEFNVKVFGNPSLSSFRLQLIGSVLEEKFTVKVVDVNGRLMEVKQNLYAGQVIELGNNYKQGTYFVEVSQGTNRKVVKLIKIGRD
ncbi:MBG domain-containing protein, partial [Lacibacter sp. H407]|uniref:MBG domain-containing protein n=1 Tax=Lacibacter sp. H407 TaxID=3133423 RepID=UPI0030C07736